MRCFSTNNEEPAPKFGDFTSKVEEATQGRGIEESDMVMDSKNTRYN
jgi:hypothetical protein